MQKKKIWLSSPHMGQREIRYIESAFNSNWIAPLGPHVDAFESVLQDYLGANHAAALSSGTAAVHLGLILMGVQQDDYVICQSMTFSASANPIKYLGAHPVFIDSEPDTWNMCPDQLELALSTLYAEGKKVAAILPVHLYGMPAKMKEINQLARHYQVPVLEDAAEALGSKYNDKFCGTLGDFGVLSFNGNKIITTSGGGALLSDREDWIQQARYLATQARDPAPHYEHSKVGYNYRLSNVLAGIGLGQMEVLNERVERRRFMHIWYRSFFQQLAKKYNGQFNFEFQEEPDGCFSNRWLTCVLIDPDKNNGLHREAIRLAMEAENIECRPLWKPMHSQPVFNNSRNFGHLVSDRLFQNGLCLPSGSNLSDSDLNRIADNIESTLKNWLK